MAREDSGLPVIILAAPRISRSKQLHVPGELLLRRCRRALCIIVRSQGRRHEILIRGVGFIGAQTHLPPKLSFSTDFGHFILKMLTKTLYVLRKKILKYPNFWRGVDPAVFKSAGVVTPRPPPRRRPCPQLTPLELLSASAGEASEG